MDNKIYVVYQRSKINRTFHVFDYEDVIELAEAYINNKDFILISGRKITICYESFLVYDVSEKFSTIDLANSELKKQFDFFSKGVPTEEGVAQHGVNITKQILNISKSMDVSTNIIKPLKSNVAGNKIFISHATADSDSVEMFVNQVLKLGLNIPAERIFCSSMAGQGVKSGKDIPDVLKEELLNSSIVFLLISKNYKQSPVSLNELGGAWIHLNKDRVIPILLSDIDFDELGFIDAQRLSKRIDNEDDLFSLIDDLKEVLNPNPSIPLLNTHVKSFIKSVNSLKPIEKKVSKIEEPKPISEWERCFTRSLYPFQYVFSKTVPHLSNGMHLITDKTTINKILNELAGVEFVNEYWYKFAGGDYYLEDMKLLPNGNWLISNWELNISELMISIDSSLQNEFILVKSLKMPPYKILSDVGGEAYQVGVLNNGIIVSENERGNGFAIIKGETVELNKYKTEPRYSSDQDNWIFLCTNYHKVGCNADISISFAEKLDNGDIGVTPENLKKFLSSLRNHSVVEQNR